MTNSFSCSFQGEQRDRIGPLVDEARYLESLFECTVAERHRETASNNHGAHKRATCLSLTSVICSFFFFTAIISFLFLFPRTVVFYVCCLNCSVLVLKPGLTLRFNYFLFSQWCLISCSWRSVSQISFAHWLKCRGVTYYRRMFTLCIKHVPREVITHVFDVYEVRY